MTCLHTQETCLNYISQFLNDIKYIKDNQNTVTDSLFWTDTYSITQDILSHNLISQDQEQDPILQEVTKQTNVLVPFSKKTVLWHTNTHEQ